MLITEVEYNGEVWVIHPVTKARKKCRVVGFSKETNEVQVVISEGCAVFKRCEDVEKV
jgi:hypothetical protein